MLYSALPLLRCPNNGRGPLRVFGCIVQRGSVEVRGIDNGQLDELDDVVLGVLLSDDLIYAYPISDGIAQLLADPDTDVEHTVGLLSRTLDHLPPEYSTAVVRTIDRLRSRVGDDVGAWNREEMLYYDASVATEDSRRIVQADYADNPMWNVFLPRWEHILAPILAELDDGWLLEVGCGGARTVHWYLGRPGLTRRYVGVDISWARLLLARSLIPSGIFIQASAMNLPFADRAFSAVFGFGVFHHLPQPTAGIRNAMNALAAEGLFALHEPIDTPKLLPEQSRLRRSAERLMEGYEHSEHDNEIPLEETFALLESNRFQIIATEYSHSIARLLLDRLCDLLPQQAPRRAAYRLAMAIDTLTIQTLCRISKRFGPRGAIIVARRRV